MSIESLPTKDQAFLIPETPFMFMLVGGDSQDTDKTQWRGTAKSEARFSAAPRGAA
jgi:hypothetical protein